ncbi:MAG: family 20 glycosylhydrolase [Bryobacterales bacterium]|nr:family 20 glycosylhydrolase [Bryobacterales bacterium]
MITRLALFLSTAWVLAAAEPVLMPQPAKLERRTGALTVDSNFRLAFARPAVPRLQRAATRFLSQLRAETGIPVLYLPAPATGSAQLLIDCAQTVDTPSEKLGADESYRLEVTPQQARLTSKTVTGTLRGLQTFLQLVSVNDKNFSAPAVLIEDSPRFPWRGLLIDVTSHFMPVPVIERTLDTMEAVKLNVFHWHLTDDQGFRVESKVFPKLHELGTEGDYYTQEDIRHIISYARDRGIRILPEFDMPGHCATWLIGYPHLASAPGPYNIIHTFGIYDPTLDPTNEQVYVFLDKLIGEMAALFPDEYFHIGGDEVTYKHWKQNPKIQAFIKQHNLKNEPGLQTYFNQRVLPIIRKHGKKMMGWDEILHQDLPKDIMVESWQNHESLVTAAQRGYQGLLSFGYYLDHLKSAGAYYSVDPFTGPAKVLTPEQTKNILGGEACMWTEFISPETIDSRMWPKSAAIAERFWSPATQTDVADMYRRLDAITHRLDFRGARHNLNYEPMLRRIAPSAPVDALKTLADALDPLGIEHREVFQKYRQDTKLNRMVDAARGDSESVRNMESAIRRWQAKPNNGDEAIIRRQLELWRANHARLEPYFPSSYLLAEFKPLSEELAQVAAIGLEALEKGHDQAWRAAQLARTEELAKPHLEVILAPTRAVRLLLQR